jgi:hypothetical protein
MNLAAACCQIRTNREQLATVVNQESMDVAAGGAEIDLDKTAEREVVDAQAIEACGGDLHATVKALIVANALLDARTIGHLCEGVARISSRPAGEAEDVKILQTRGVDWKLTRLSFT